MLEKAVSESASAKCSQRSQVPKVPALEGGNTPAVDSGSSSPPIEAWPSTATSTSDTSTANPTLRLMPVAIHVTLLTVFGGAYLYNVLGRLLLRGRASHIVTDFIYLTHWNLAFQVVFNAAELASDLNASFALRTASIRAKVFHTIIMPFSFFVCSFFWTICFVNENLVREKELSERYADWYNHVVHTLIVPAALLESIAAYHKPSPVIESFSITVICGFIYTCWSFMWGILFDLWSYELFRILSLPGYLLLLLISVPIMCIFQTIGRLVHLKIWSMMQHCIGRNHRTRPN